MKKVLPRQKLRFPASTFNSMIDAAQDYQNRRSSLRVPRGASSTSEYVLIRNDSGADREQYDVLGLDDPVVLPSENENEFLQRWAISAVLATDDHEKKFCILLEPIADGEFGRALIVGVCPAYVVREAGETAMTAGVEAGEVDLFAGKTGVNILWEESGAADGDPRWTLVQAPSIGTGGSTASARAAVTSAADTHSGLTARDGVTLADGDVVLDWRNVTASLRGLWSAHSGAWTRYGTLTSGMLITVREGTTRKDTTWLLDTNAPITVGTTSLNFVQLSQVQSVIRARVKSSSSVTHSGFPTIDGVTVADGDQVFDAPNVYTAASGSWSTFASAPNMVVVFAGTANGPLMYVKDSGGSYVAVGGVYT